MRRGKVNTWALALLLTGCAGGDSTPTESEPELDEDGDGSPASEDCDDDDPSVYPGAEESCDGRDEDCDGVVDEVDVEWFMDADGDGWGTSSVVHGGCVPEPGQAAEAGDCDDEDASVFPGAPEAPCDGLDQDCDGAAEAALVDGLPHETIQGALDAAPHGGEVAVCPGTWTEELSLVDRNLTLTSWSGSADDTVLDGEDTHAHLLIEGGDVVVSHLGFSRAFATSIYAVDGDVSLLDSVFDDTNREAGTLVVLLGGARYVVERCTLTGNEDAVGSMGGLQVQSEGEVAIRDTTFTDLPGMGLTLSLYGGTGEISGSEFTGNLDGGADLRLADGTSLEVSGSTFTGNSSMEGGGISAWLEGGAHLGLDGCTLEENDAGWLGGALAVESHEYEGVSEGGTLTIADCAFLANEAWVMRGSALALEGGALEVEITGSEFSGNTLVSTLSSYDGLDHTLVIADSSFLENDAGGEALILVELGRLDLTVQGTDVEDNLCDDGVLHAGYASDLEARFVETTFTENYGAFASVFSEHFAGVEACSVTFDTCSLWYNDSAGTRTGAVVLSEVCDLESLDTDWGLNMPWDVCDADWECANWDLGETFTCTAGLC